MTMRTEKVWQPSSVPAEAGRIPEVRERRGKNPQRQAPPAPVSPEPEKDEEQETENQKSHLDTLA
ncbi:MAG: hypothetical protein RMK89_10835 [Armatimonadota bacterium]|nr:hypothetical protein [Armatimonadota bacterium]MDW8143944.1 hypothetical protein [Armatimonadota bacterium]